jgi:hypothetical protein
VAGKGSRRGNMAQKYIHMYVNAKIIPVKSIPGMGIGIKKSSGEGEFK